MTQWEVADAVHLSQLYDGVCINGMVQWHYTTAPNAQTNLNTYIVHSDQLWREAAVDAEYTIVDDRR